MVVEILLYEENAEEIDEGEYEYIKPSDYVRVGKVEVINMSDNPSYLTKTQQPQVSSDDDDYEKYKCNNLILFGNNLLRV